MSSKNLYRVGGIAAIVSVLLTLISTFSTSDFFIMGLRFSYFSFLLDNVLLTLVAWALYHLYVSTERNLSLAALILPILGTGIILINALPYIDLPGGTANIAWICTHVIPILLFGILAYRHPQFGMHRVLAGIGILYAFLFLILYEIFPDLNLGVVNGLPLYLYIAWLSWSGILLLVGNLQESPEGVSFWGIDKLKSFFASPALKNYPKSCYLTALGFVVMASIVMFAIVSIRNASTNSTPESSSVPSEATPLGDLLRVPPTTPTSEPPSVPSPTAHAPTAYAGKWFGEQSVWKPDLEILGAELSEIYTEPFQEIIPMGVVVAEDWEYGLKCLYIDFNGHNCYRVIAPDLNSEMFNDEYLRSIDSSGISIYGTLYNTRNYDFSQSGVLFIIEKVELN